MKATQLLPLLVLGALLSLPVFATDQTPPLVLARFIQAHANEGVFISSRGQTADTTTEPKRPSLPPQ